eukprot:scaffold497395_cov33-Prasinocladus_malaysianus.AAC.1
MYANVDGLHEIRVIPPKTGCKVVAPCPASCNFHNAGRALYLIFFHGCSPRWLTFAHGCK